MSLLHLHSVFYSVLLYICRQCLAMVKKLENLRQNLSDTNRLLYAKMAWLRFWFRFWFCVETSGNAYKAQSLVVHACKAVWKRNKYYLTLTNVSLACCSGRKSAIRNILHTWRTAALYSPFSSLLPFHHNCLAWTELANQCSQINLLTSGPIIYHHNIM